MAQCCGLWHSNTEHSTKLRTVDNHGNTEVAETVIFVKCRECRDFAKMPCFMFSQEYFVFNQHCVNLTQKYLPFLCLCYQSPCALLLIGGICHRDVIVVGPT